MSDLDGQVKQIVDTLKKGRPNLFTDVIKQIHEGKGPKPPSPNR